MKNLIKKSAMKNANKFFVFILILLASSNLKAANYYWVGGTGNWSDFANHWATTSGGTTFHLQPPTANDDVFFDANSFSAGGQAITVDQPSNFCKNFSWQGTVSGSNLLAIDTTYQIRILGSFSKDASTTFSYYGTLSFESPFTGNTLSIPDTLSCIIEFNNPAGEWSLTADLKLKGSVKLIAGTFTTNSFNITTSQFISNYSTVGRALNLGSSFIKIKDFEYEESSFGSAYVAYASLIIDNLVTITGSPTEVLFEIPHYADTASISFPPGIFYTEVAFSGGNHNYSSVTGSTPYYYGDHFVGMQGGVGFGKSTVGSIRFHNMVHTFITYKELDVDTILLTGDTDPQLWINGISDTLRANYINAGTIDITVPKYCAINKMRANGNFTSTVPNFGGIPSNIDVFKDLYVAGDFSSDNFMLVGGFNSPHFIKCVINGDGSFIDYCSFDTLMLNAGQSYVLDANDSIAVNNNFTAFGSSGNFISINSDLNGTQSNILFTNGNVCSDYLILRDINAIGSNILSGINSVDLGNNTGWQFAPCTIVSDVWPGDANYDLIVNNNDVLNIGLAYNETGPVRAGATLNYVAQPATDWNGYFQTAVNKKHADTDGNGIIDSDDTLAISLNYGLSHPARYTAPVSNTSLSPQLYLIANPDTVIEGDTVSIEIYLGTTAIPVDSIYGIAFTINIDTSLIDTTYMPFDYTGGWMGTPGVDLLTFEKKLFSQGKVDVALTRTDHNNVNGFGYLGKAGVVIVDNVGARLTTTPPYVTLPISISNITALTASEYYLAISSGNEDVAIDTLGTTGLSAPLTENNILIFPNPAKEKLNIISLSQKINSIKVYDVMGKEILKTDPDSYRDRGRKSEIDVRKFDRGIYSVKVFTDKGVITKKVVVVK